MADTGERSPQAQSGVSTGGANTIDSDESTTGVVIQFSGTAAVSTWSDFDGDDIPVGATIDGVKLIVRASYNSSFAATKFLGAVVSLDGASGTYSVGSQGAQQNITTSATDYNFGAADNTWNSDWSDWTDLSDLAFRVTLTQQSGTALSITSIYEVDAIVYYTEASVTVSTTTLKVLSGYTILKSGKLLIN